MKGFTRLLLVVFLLEATVAHALDPERHISELAHRSWGTKDGAPPYVGAIVQTTDGYLWFAGYRGLYRFDGVRFQPFEAFSSQKLLSRNITSLFAQPKGKLWIGYRNGGVSVLEAGKLTHYDSANGFPEGRVMGFAQDRTGRVWVASSGGLAFLEGGRWRAVGAESNFPGLGAQAVLVDHLGALWVAGEHRVAVLDRGSSKFEIADEPYNGQVWQLAESPEGTVWMVETTRAVRPLERPGHRASFSGLSRADCQIRFLDTWQTERRCQRPDDLEVRVGSAGILFDRNGSFWITTLGDGLRRAPYPSHLKKEPIGEFSRALEQFMTKDGLTADVVTSIFEDREGNIWTGTRDGVDQFRNTALAPVDLSSNAGDLHLAPGDEGFVFAAGISDGIFRFHDAHEKTVMANAGSGELARLGGSLGFLYRDPLGSIWVQGIEGACRLVGQQCLDRVERPAGERGKRGQLGILRWRFGVDENRRLWGYVENEGLFVRDNGYWKAVTSAPSVATGLVPETQFTDVSGQIWFGFSNGQILSVKDGLVRTHTLNDGLTLGAIKAIDSFGTHVWVGGEHGLAVQRGSRFTSVLPYDVPAFDDVSGVVEGGDGSLWLNEYRGVVRISPEEVESVLQNPAHRARYERFDSNDGLPGVVVGRGVFPTAIRGTDGRLWFAASRGAAWVKPEHLHRNDLPPPVAIQSIVADGKMFFPNSKLKLPGTMSNLQVTYTGMSFAVPDRVQFRYRLKGFDHEWQNAGTGRTADYTRLPPGSYDFQVIASNDAGVWNNVGAELPIIITPAWYQTLWFYALCALFVIAALAALYRTRVAQVRSQMRRLLEARLSERERIARELHDTLLQGVQGLIWRLQGTANRIPPEQPARQEMQQSLDQADQLLAESRDRVKDLRPAAREVIDLAQALAEEGEELAPQYSAKFWVTVQGERRNLHPIVREEAFLIGREALRNAFRHAGAQDIEAELTYDEAALHLRVRDDGGGIGGSVLEAGGTPGHFGLVGMQERAKKLGGLLAIWSKPEAGTEIELKVPANVAYVRSDRSSGLRSMFAIFRRRAQPL
jgi:signal transduction histidine kinase/ligand-binding sensor domain-containing protein